MKALLRILLLLIIVAAISAGVYYLVNYSKLQKKQLKSFLQENAVAYYDGNLEDLDRIINEVNGSLAQFDPNKQISDSSLLKKLFLENTIISSWHLTRQNDLSKVYWILTSEDYEIDNDTLSSVEKIKNLYQVKSNGESFFMAKSQNVIALCNKGEIIEAISGFDFHYEGSITSIESPMLKGNWNKLQKYLKNKSQVFSVLDINAKSYEVDYHSAQGVIFYNLLLDSVQFICDGSGKANFNESLPISTVAAWQSNFTSNDCMLEKHVKNIEQQLWEIEERYQIKVSTILDAWFDGSFRNIYCDFNGISSQFAVVKLKPDAAPFASGSRFFVDYENLSIGNEIPQENYTIARVIPEGLLNIVFPENEKDKSLFVTQYNDHLYFASKRDPLVLLLNELITGNKMSSFDARTPALHHFFLKYPLILDFGQTHDKSSVNQLIQGKSLFLGNKLIVQGQIFTD